MFHAQLGGDNQDPGVNGNPDDNMPSDVDGLKWIRTDDPSAPMSDGVPFGQTKFLDGADLAKTFQEQTYHDAVLLMTDLVAVSTHSDLEFLNYVDAADDDTDAQSTWGLTAATPRSPL